MRKKLCDMTIKTCFEKLNSLDSKNKISLPLIFLCLYEIRGQTNLLRINMKFDMRERNRFFHIILISSQMLIEDYKDFFIVQFRS